MFAKSSNSALALLKFREVEVAGSNSLAPTFFFCTVATPVEATWELLGSASKRSRFLETGNFFNCDARQPLAMPDWILNQGRIAGFEGSLHPKRNLVLLLLRQQIPGHGRIATNHSFIGKALAIVRLFGMGPSLTAAAERRADRGRVPHRWNPFVERVSNLSKS